jgi:hypothetical protein
MRKTKHLRKRSSKSHVSAVFGSVSIPIDAKSIDPKCTIDFIVADMTRSALPIPSNLDWRIVGSDGNGLSIVSPDIRQGGIPSYVVAQGVIKLASE